MEARECNVRKALRGKIKYEGKKVKWKRKCMRHEQIV